VVTPGNAERVPQRSWNPVKWLTSRDRTPLNYLGLALLTGGAATAVATWLARFTSKAVPWWPVILGLVVLVVGLALALATIGPRSQGVPDPPIEDAGEAESSAEEAESSQPSADPGRETEAEEPPQTRQKYAVQVRGDVHGLAQGDNQTVTMNFGTPGTGARGTKPTGTEPQVRDGE
jgi:hypothetical protein